MNGLGVALPRLEDAALLAGRGRFVDDIHLPGTLHAAFVRSPHAHALVEGIDRAPALAVPGVHTVLIDADLPAGMRATPLPLMAPHPFLARPRMPQTLAGREVCHVGEPVAVVLADSRYIAEDAAALIGLGWRPLPAVADCRDALEPEAPRVHQDRSDNLAATFTTAYGEVDAAFRRAARVVAVSLSQHRGSGHAIEGRAVLASHDPVEGKLTVWSAGQLPHIDRRNLEILLGLDPSQVRVVMPDVGGGFGSKAPFYPEEAAVAAAAMLVGRPVKWIEDRYETFLTALQERDQYWDMEMALAGDGRILAVRGRMLHDGGAYSPHGIVLPLIAATTVPGPYVVPAFRLDVTVAMTNLVPTAPVRGAGRPQAVFAMERLMDKAARTLALDPAELRRRNLIRPEQMPYRVGLIFRDGKPLTYDSGDYPACLAKALAIAGHAGFPARRAAARAEGRRIGFGIANYVEGTGLGPFEGATVRVLPSGRVRVLSGAAPQGQGHRTTIAQVVAAQLGIAPDAVDVVLADTDAIPMGVGTFASRIAANAMPAAHLAAGRVRARLVRLAAHALEAAEADIELADGRAHVRGVPAMNRSFADLARLALGNPGLSLPEGIEPGLEDTHYFGPAQAAYCNGTHVAEVEVDVGTCRIRVVNYWVAHDSGRLINPLIVDGQVQGGVAHGIGNALFEFMGYDQDGQPLTTTFADYLLPQAADVPDVVTAHLETPTPLNPLGVKGAGEGGTVPAAAAIAAAVEDALSEWGIEIARVPILPAALFERLEAAGAFGG